MCVCVCVCIHNTFTNIPENLVFTYNNLYFI